MDLSSSAVGGRVVACNDEFFAPAGNLLAPADPVWKEGVYTDRGKWMDGWETRRRRDPGHDWCVLALGIPGRVEQVTVDTSYFTGNYPEEFSLGGCGSGDDDRLDDWVELLPRTRLQGDSMAVFPVSAGWRITHLRLNIYPDGGVARLRVEGSPIPDQVCPETSLIDLVSAVVGGEALDASDLHYSPPSNMLRPSAPAGMWDGWETRRRRGPGHDWAVFRLGLPGTVREVVVDTRHFKGNAPGWVSLHLSEDGDTWEKVLDRVAVQADTENRLVLPQPQSARRIKIDIHPDGGVARLRVMGRPGPVAAAERRLTYLNSLLPVEAVRLLLTACSSTRWAGEMAERRPFADVTTLLAGSAEVFALLDEPDWMEAFAGHPRIGERGDAVSTREQAGVKGDEVRQALAGLNRAYEEKFGFTYIVYATGKSGEEMAELARGRLGSTREEELVAAADEQTKITATRLRRIVCVGDQS